MSFSLFVLCVYVCVRVIVSMRFQCVCIHVNMRLLRVGEEGVAAGIRIR